MRALSPISHVTTRSLRVTLVCFIASNSLCGMLLADGGERAAASVGAGESSILALVREVTEWRNRALDAEAQLAELGVKPQSRQVQSPGVVGASVLKAVPEERVLLVGIGTEAGALPGALTVVGASVYARVLEARSAVSAVLVDQSFSGDLTALEGKPVRLAVR